MWGFHSWCGLSHPACPEHEHVEALLFSCALLWRAVRNKREGRKVAGAGQSEILSGFSAVTKTEAAKMQSTVWEQPLPGFFQLVYSDGCSCCSCSHLNSDTVIYIFLCCNWVKTEVKSNFMLELVKLECVKQTQILAKSVLPWRPDVKTNNSNSEWACGKERDGGRAFKVDRHTICNGCYK